MPTFKYVLSTIGVSKESISKFLIGNRFHVKLRNLSPYSNRIFFFNKDYLRPNSSWHEWSGKFLTALQMSMDGAFLIYTLSLPLAVPSRVVGAFHPVDDSWLSNMDVSHGIFDRWSVVDRMEGPCMHVWYKTMQKRLMQRKTSTCESTVLSWDRKKMICQLEWSS